MRARQPAFGRSAPQGPDRRGGGKDDWIWFHIPVGYLYAIGNPRADWLFQTEIEAGLGGRSLAYPRGKVVGGCSAINAMIYMRGQAADYDGWRQQGLEGWGWDEVLPFFLKHEDHIAPDGRFHRAGGELRVEHPRVRWDILDAVREAAEAAGIRKIDDFNTGDNEGSSYFQVTQKRGRRFSAARAFLEPALDRDNLRVELGCLVERILVEDGRAVGVVLSRGGERYVARASGRSCSAPAPSARPPFSSAPASATASACAGSASTSSTMLPASARICRTICSCGRSTRSRA